MKTTIERLLVLGVLTLIDYIFKFPLGFGELIFLWIIVIFLYF